MSGGTPAPRKHGWALPLTGLRGGLPVGGWVTGGEASKEQIKAIIEEIIRKVSEGGGNVVEEMCEDQTEQAELGQPGGGWTEVVDEILTDQGCVQEDMQGVDEEEGEKLSRKLSEKLSQIGKWKEGWPNYKGREMADNILDVSNHSIQNSSLLSEKLNEDGSSDLREEGSLFNVTQEVVDEVLLSQVVMLY